MLGVQPPKPERVLVWEIIEEAVVTIDNDLGSRECTLK